jgi:hypothetical protein
MALSDLFSHRLDDPSAFNWPWFIELCVAGILVLFFLFYFNRLYATIVSYAIRSYLWHAYRVWVDIQALQISLLGGRIFFKGVRYHGENETVLIHSGFVTWLYWLRSVRQEDNHQSMSGETEKANSQDTGADVQTRDEELGSVKKADTSEARISVHVSGLEWFIYNRTPMYDAILHSAGDDVSKDARLDATSNNALNSTPRKFSIATVLRRRYKPDDDSLSESLEPGQADPEKSVVDDQQSLRSAGVVSNTTESSIEGSAEVSTVQALLVRLLPVHIECSRAAISMGNEHTKALLVTTFEKAEGHIDAGGCGPHDIFRQLFDFEVKHPIIQMRPNPDFRTSQMMAAERIIENISNSPPQRKWWQPRFDLSRRKREAVYSLRHRIPWLRSSVESLHYNQHQDRKQSSYMHFADSDPGSGPWHGLDRYLDENEGDDHLLLGRSWSCDDGAP